MEALDGRMEALAGVVEGPGTRDHGGRDVFGLAAGFRYAVSGGCYEGNGEDVTHEEMAGRKGRWRKCSSHDLILVAEGLQCGNCLALTRDHGATWEDTERKAVLPRSFEVSPGKVNRGGCY